MHNFRFVRGKYSDYKEDLKELFEGHADEILPFATEELELKIDDEFYTSLEELNRYAALALYDGDEVIGYISVFINPHPHHMDTNFAMTDCFYIMPSKRGYSSFKLLVNAFNALEKILKEEYNAHYLFLNTSAKKELRALADYLGCKKCDIIYVKKL